MSSRRDYFIIDTRTGRIINCVNTDSQESADRVAASFIGGELMKATANPTAEQLEGYRYWRERP